MSLHSLLTQTADIERNANARDSSGGDANSWTAVYEDLPVRIFVKDSETDQNNRREGSSIPVKVYTDTAVSVRIGDRVVSGGSYYYVTQPSKDMCGLGLGYKIVCELRV